jgi:hypothetical protein
LKVSVSNFPSAYCARSNRSYPFLHPHILQYSDLLNHPIQPQPHRVATLKQEGKSLEEVVAAKPTAALDSRWGTSLVSGALFTRLVYAGV